MNEKIMLIGGPGTGKSTQLRNVIDYLEEKNKRVFVIDLEGKFETMILASTPKNMELFTAIYWQDIKVVHEKFESKIKEGDWILVDRIDLSWPAVQRWFALERYEIELADKLVDQAKAMKKSSMFIPEFDQGSWQPINAQYDTFILRLLHKYKANIIFTAGVTKMRDDVSTSIYEVFGHLGVVPRGQKELSHQPHSVLLLHHKIVDKEIEWLITTAKDIKGREYFKNERLYDFSMQYLSKYGSRK